MVASIDEMLALYGRVTTIATVGASINPDKPAHSVPAYLIAQGYRVIPVNPTADEIHGVPAVASLADIADSIDVVQVFRPAEDAPAIAAAAVAIGAKALWLQKDITSAQARHIASEGGLMYVEDHCMGVESARRGITKTPA